MVMLLSLIIATFCGYSVAIANYGWSVQLIAADFYLSVLLRCFI